MLLYFNIYGLIFEKHYFTYIVIMTWEGKDRRELLTCFKSRLSMLEPFETNLARGRVPMSLPAGRVNRESNLRLLILRPHSQILKLLG
ncbi:hypothetical protein RIF29_06185 [Crotalaria pallida]|uniref:Uncharacterized protein n=1 Tax=Crotalaria pallida TaxID=3830 RepID=A0AAN9J2X7_CROPI